MSYSDIIIARNPISYWRLGETSGSIAVDEMGVQNGTYESSPSMGQDGPPFITDSKSVLCDGVKYVNIPHNALHGGMATVVIEAWVKLHTPNQQQNIVRKWGYIDNLPYEYYALNFSGASNLVACAACNGSAQNYTIATVGEPNEEWLYVVALYKSGVFYTYVNNVLKSTNTYAILPTINNNIQPAPIWIGYSGTNWRKDANVNICEVAIYDYDWYTDNPHYPVSIINKIYPLHGLLVFASDNALNNGLFAHRLDKCIKQNSELIELVDDTSSLNL